uniref:hypothetical protein n=1 Tax=uncultured Draconibacterium sp. TaxID=1573823 RepID=UPI0032176E71
MSNLEHNIKEAFIRQDANTRFADKDSVWNRLEGEMRQRKGVASIWRIAAILLGFLVVTGAGAALYMRAKQQAKLNSLMLENTKLTTAVDSLLLVPAKTQIKIIEKEKVVYRERTIVENKASETEYWEVKYRSLMDSTEMILTNIGNTYEKEVARLTNELKAAKNEITRIHQDKNTSSADREAAPFQLKSERIDIGISKKPSVKDPEIEMKILQKNFIENRNNLNRTIFKK